MRVFVLYAFCLLACEAGSCGGSVPKASVPPATPSVASAAPSTSASIAPRFDLATVSPFLAHPAMAPVKTALLAKDSKAAADSLKTAIESGKLGGDDLDRAHWLRGKLLKELKDDDGADAEWSAIRDTSKLHPYASLRHALYLAHHAKPDEALAIAEKAPEIAHLAPDVHFVVGDARAAKNEHALAADAYGKERKGARAVEALIRYAEEIVAAGGANDETLIECAKGARRVRFEHPTSSLAPRAEEAEKKCKPLGPPTALEDATAAQAWLDAGKAKEAIPFANKLLATEKKGTDAWCRAGMVLARASEKLRERKSASDAYGDVATACTEESVRVLALYDGAKAALSAKLPDVARARWATLEKDFPKHRLADDARVRGAQVAIDAGDVAKGEAMLAALPDDYPQGDMKSEALFKLALVRMKKGDWAGATPYLEKSIALVPREDGYFVAGRALYFLGRAKLETGATADGLAKLHTVIAQEPFSFAAAMAYARVAAKSPEEATKAKTEIEHAIEFEPKGELFDLGRPETATPAFARAVELARVGESDLARKELALAGLLGDAAKDPEGSWLAAALFARAGDAKAAHGIPRVRLTDWVHHFPGGKWRAAWEIAFPRPYREVVEEESNKRSVPPSLVWAVMREESAFDSDATSPSAAYGLLQLIVPTAAHYGKPLKLPTDAKSLLRPDVNIPLGTAYLAKLRTEFPENAGYAVPSYNAGEGATHRWLSPPLAATFDLWVESIPYDETRKYTKRVLASYWAYVALYEPARLEAALRASAGGPELPSTAVATNKE
ncbi:MAG: transglycosylase SLT domain-containing protein [Polyangiales bacterium]